MADSGEASRRPHSPSLVLHAFRFKPSMHQPLGGLRAFHQKSNFHQKSSFQAKSACGSSGTPYGASTTFGIILDLTPSVRMTPSSASLGQCPTILKWHFLSVVQIRQLLSWGEPGLTHSGGLRGFHQNSSSQTRSALRPCRGTSTIRKCTPAKDPTPLGP